MTVKILTSIAQLQRYRIPAVVAIHAPRQNTTIHTNEAYVEEKRRESREEKSVHVTDRLTWSLSGIARVEKVDLVGLDSRLRIDVAIPRQAPLSVYLKHSIMLMSQLVLCFDHLHHTSLIRY